jgi:hypothetical protein
MKNYHEEEGEEIFSIIVNPTKILIVVVLILSLYYYTH